MKKLIIVFILFICFTNVHSQCREVKFIDLDENGYIFKAKEELVKNTNDLQVYISFALLFLKEGTTASITTTQFSNAKIIIPREMVIDYLSPLYENDTLKASTMQDDIGSIFISFDNLKETTIKRLSTAALKNITFRDIRTKEELVIDVWEGVIIEQFNCILKEMDKYTK